MLFINISSYKNLLLYMIFFKNGRPIICFKIKKKIGAVENYLMI